MTSGFCVIKPLDDLVAKKRFQVALPDHHWSIDG